MPKITDYEDTEIEAIADQAAAFLKEELLSNRAQVLIHLNGTVARDNNANQDEAGTSINLELVLYRKKNGDIEMKHRGSMSSGAGWNTERRPIANGRT